MSRDAGQDHYRRYLILNKIIITTDSCADIGRATREKYGIEYVKMCTVLDGKETPASLDWEYYSPKELYDIIRTGKRVFTTQVPEQEFETAFEKWASEGYDVIYIGCSLKQSGSVNTGAVVAKAVMEKYPDSKIFCIDSQNACTGEGLLAIRASEHRAEGMSSQEIYDKIMTERKLVNEYCAVHTLDALKRAGRVKASAAFFGNMLGVKPIIIADKEGYQTPIKKVRGRKQSLEELVNLLADSIVDAENQTVYVSHSDAEEEAKEVAALVKERTNCKDVVIDFIGPIIGASLGADAIAVFAFGKEVTFEGKA